MPVEAVNPLVAESLANKGIFGQLYDAHVANIKCVDGVQGKAGEFTPASRMAVYGMELLLYVDGKPMKAELIGKDRKLTTNQAVRLSVGCFGYSRPTFHKLGFKPFTGALDEVSVWNGGRTALFDENGEPLPALGAFKGN